MAKTKAEMGDSDPEPGSKNICVICDSEIIYVVPDWKHTDIRQWHTAIPGPIPEDFKTEVGGSEHIPGSKFAQIDLWIIAEKAENMANAPGQKQMWAQAYWALALAADHLHAMFAWSTAPKDERELIHIDDLAEESAKEERG